MTRKTLAEQPSAPSDGQSQTELPLHVKHPASEPQLLVRNRLVKTDQGKSFFLSVEPPQEPAEAIEHVASDIVLVLDISGSMQDRAPEPGESLETDKNGIKESTGLTVLDLCKHAIRTILSTLNEGDRLGLVTFSTDARTVHSLSSMTPSTKEDLLKKVEKLRPRASTNMWAGIKAGLDMFEYASSVGNVQGMYVLTDGQPNYMCPKQGYVAKLGPMLDELTKTKQGLVPSIHTFGFGYDIRSELMQSIAEVGAGNYSFIPDAGMIGTVFVHAVANLQSTCFVDAVLELKPSSKDLMLVAPTVSRLKTFEGNGFSIQLGNIQYGQSKDLFVDCYSSPNNTPQIQGRLVYRTAAGKEMVSPLTPISMPEMDLADPQAAYHFYRTKLVRCLNSLFPLKSNGEHAAPQRPEVDKETGTCKANEQYQQRFDALIKLIQQDPLSTSDPDVASLLADLAGPSSASTLDSDSQSTDTTVVVEDSAGQITKALLQTKDHPYWWKWGRHYLPSIFHAHMSQTCNSFKDPGPLRYGINSPLFIKCRDKLDAAFDNLPAPTPSLFEGADDFTYAGGTNIHGVKKKSFKMSHYNSRSNPCFLGGCLVTVGPESQTIKVEDLRVGMQVVVPNETNDAATLNVRSVEAIIKTTLPTSTLDDKHASNNMICRIDRDLWITPYHPVFHPSTAKWVFPIDVAEETRPLNANEAVYSIILASSSNVEDHAVQINGVTCLTLGHGLTHPPTSEKTGKVNTTDSNATAHSEEENTLISKDFSTTTPVHVEDESKKLAAEDVRTHPFFGDHQRVSTSLAELPTDFHGRHLCAGLRRDRDTGLACGFQPLDTTTDTNTDTDTLTDLKNRLNRGHNRKQGNWCGFHRMQMEMNRERERERVQDELVSDDDDDHDDDVVIDVHHKLNPRGNWCGANEEINGPELARMYAKIQASRDQEVRTVS